MAALLIKVGPYGRSLNGLANSIKNSETHQTG